MKPSIAKQLETKVRVCKLPEIFDMERPQLINLCDLKTYPNNPTKQKDKAMQFLSKSIDDNGMIEHFYLNNKNEILGGNQRYSILKDKGIESAWCIIPKVQLTKEQEKKLIIVFNSNRFKNAANTFDIDIFAQEYEFVLEEYDLDISDIECVAEDIDAADSDTKQRNREDFITEDLTGDTAKYIKFGDIIELQGHRLMCGDSFDKNCIDKLLNSTIIDAIYTDPPYGMNLDTDFSQMSKYSNSSVAGVAGKSYKKVEGDDKPFDPTFILQAFEHIEEIFL